MTARLQATGLAVAFAAGILALDGCALPASDTPHAKGWRQAWVEQLDVDPTRLNAHLQTCAEQTRESQGTRLVLLGYWGWRHKRQILIPLAPDIAPQRADPLWVHPGTCDPARLAPP